MKTSVWLCALGMAGCAAFAEDVKQDDGPLIAVEVRVVNTDEKGLNGADIFSYACDKLRVVTPSGQPASTNITTEYLYPEKFELIFSTAEGRAKTKEPPAIVMPENFNMEKVGLLMDATPTWNPQDKTIDLDVVTSIVNEPTWYQFEGVDENGKAIKDGKYFVALPMECPLFPKLKVSKKVKLQDGAHIVYGGFKDVPKKCIWYFVIKASVVKEDVR